MATRQATARTHHFVLVHGLGHGAWCWYKVTPLLEAAGHRVTAVDLTSSGVSKVPPDTVLSVAQYAQPLTDVLLSIQNDHKVILVGHCLGGSIVSYVMDLFPRKIHMAIYVAAMMPINGDAVLPDVYARPLVDMELLEVSLDVATLNISKSIDYLYSRSPAEDVALAKCWFTPIPVAPLFDRLTLSRSKHGTIPRHYIATMEDQLLPIGVQEQIVWRDGHATFHRLADSDHSPFFSQPCGLTDLLLAIANESMRVPSRRIPWRLRRRLDAIIIIMLVIIMNDYINN